MSAGGVSARLRLAVAVVLGALGVVGIAAPSSGASSSTGAPAAAPAQPTKLPYAPGPSDLTESFPSSAVLRAEGFVLYQQSCSSCHGFAAQGQRGIAPSLRDVGAGPVDFYLSTGRMPLQDPQDEPERGTPMFSREQINALIAYISSFGGPPAPAADPAAGDLAQGQSVFTENCAGCHQIVGRGGLVLGAYVPDLQSATAQQIAEAVRIGPYVMPRFSPSQIDQPQLNSLVKYVLYTRRPDDAGGWGIGNIGPIPEGIVAWFIALFALVIVARLIGERMA